MDTGCSEHIVSLAGTMQTSLVYLFGEPNEATGNARFLAANTTNSIGTNSSINNIICWDECITMNTTNTNTTNMNADATSDKVYQTVCLNECIDLDAIDITQTDTCWSECFTLDTTNSANMTANATNSSITGRNIAYDIIDDLMNTNTDANTGDLICLKECIDSIDTPSPTDAPLSIKDLFNDAIKDSSGEMSDDEWNPNNLTDGEILKQTLEVYGSIFSFSLILFCVVRRMFPRAYNLRSGWISEDVVKSNQLAKNPETFGWISWIWKVLLVSDVELSDECGMDALCVSRVLEWGVRLTAFGSLVGCLLLMPVYATAGGVHDGEKGIERLNTSNVPNGSDGHFVATVLGAYLVFGYVMYTTLGEFEWFYRFRYDLLTRSIPRNYVVYIRNLPEEYRTKKALIDYFSHFEDPSVSLGGEERLGFILGDHNNNSLNATKAWVALTIPRLKTLVEKRAAVISKLERQINVQDICDRYPKTRCSTTGQIISLVDALFAELEELNAEITASIDKIEMRASLENPKEYDAEDYQNPYREDKSENGDYMGGYAKSTTNQLFFDAKPIESFDDPRSETPAESLAGLVPGSIGDELTDMEEDDETSMSTNYAFVDKVITEIDHKGKPRRRSSMIAVVGKVGKVAGTAANVVGTQVGHCANIMGTQVGKTANIVGTQVGKAANLVPFLGSKEDDGAPMTAGFVAFSTLKACQAAKQMVHSREVFGMEVLEAPGFDDIFWNNVGKTHKELQMGLLLSFVLTVNLCLFWTLVMAAIATLSSVQGLVIVVPVIGEWMEAAPWLETLLAQISPLMIIAADEFLKIILEILSGLEGPVSGMVVQASLFTKISSFKIIQTFFVSAVSGSLISQLSEIAVDPKRVVTLLANALPNRSSFFIQIILVDVFVSLSSELLRVSAVGQAIVRSCIGPKLTEDERRTTSMFIRPLADPRKFEHAEVLGGFVLYFVVFFVYAPLAPITSIFTFLCFLIMGVAYRNQFIFIYQTLPDSGGKLWIQFMKIVPACLLIGEVTISGFLAAKQAPVASAMMFPLLAITILFNIYIRQKHFMAADFLPGCDCVKADRRNNIDGPMDLRFISNHYRQPELRYKELYPSNASLQLQLKHGLIGV